MEINVKKIKVIKWTILYSMICIFIFAAFIVIETSCIMDNSTYLKSTEEGDVSYQSINSKNESSIVIWNSSKISDRVVRVDDNRRLFKIISDTYSEGQILFQYSYLNKNGREIYGNGVYDLNTKSVELSDIKGNPEEQGVIEGSPFDTYNNSINKNASKILKKNIAYKLFIDKVLAAIAIFVVIGAIIICLFLYKSFIIKLMIFTEIAMILLAGITMRSVSDRIEKDEINEIVNDSSDKLKNASYTLNESGKIDYEILDNSFDEIVIMDKKADETFVGALKGNYDSEWIKRFEKLADKVDSKDKTSTKRMKSGNTEYMAVIICDISEVSTERAIIGFVELSETREKISCIMKDLSDRLLVVFTIVNVIIIALFIRYHIGFKRFSNTLLMLVRRHDDFNNVDNSMKELSREFGALDEINRIFGNIKYERNQNCELYNKFIPRDVEKVFGKKSLLDIELGDSVELTGSVATINIDDDSFTSNDIYMHTIENAYEIVNINRKKRDGIIVSQDSRMSDTKVLFQNGINSAIEFAIDTIQSFDSNINIANKDKIIFINYSTYQCGITGCEERLIPYLFSKEETIILNYIESFRRAGIKLILTENAIEKANRKYNFRYIGYITEKGRNIKLYECLEAYLPVKRNLLINTQDKFKKALGLFYTNDFYLARNTFNEVLKENPDDKIARWYLFNCEYNLNNTSDDETNYGLFENKILEQQYQI